MNEQQVIDHLDARQPEIVDWLKAFLRIPSVSADPSFAPGMHEARRFLIERLQQIGLAGVRLLDGDGEPAVYGEWNGAPGHNPR
jgi:acetylornithine deacetylase/succinyl-diaminopimelate desuccinylase-like protein